MAQKELFNFSQLLIDVQRKSNINVAKVRDVKFLKEEIEVVTGTKIGFNTLRRLFGFLEEKSPSQSTLNRLSNYLGYNSFSNYLNHKSNYNDWYFQQDLLQLRSQQTLSERDIDYINATVINENNIVYLAYFIAYHIEKNHVELIVDLFSKLDFQKISRTQLHKFGIIIALSLSGLSAQKEIQFYNALIRYDNFREVIPLLHIDYSNLKNRYAKVLQLIEKNNANSSDLFFAQLMQVYKAFYIDGLPLDKIQKVSKPPKFEEFFVTLKGRYFGVAILCAYDTLAQLKKVVRKACQENKINFFLIEIIPALLFIEAYDFLEELMNKYYEDVFEGEVWSSETTNAIYLIGLAGVNIQNQNYTAASRNLEMVDINHVEIGYREYVSLFYHVILLKMSFKLADNPQNQRIYKILQDLIRKTGFKRFNNLTAKYCLHSKPE